MASLIDDNAVLAEIFVTLRTGREMVFPGVALASIIFTRHDSVNLFDGIIVGIDEYFSLTTRSPCVIAHHPSIF